MTVAADGLYVHLPFCSRVCPYCDFAVRTGDAARRRRFVDTLLREIELTDARGWRFDTIYFGGGTPSQLEPEQLARVLEGLRRAYAFDADTRVFLEANPEDVTPSRLRDWRDLGIGTLSLGVQSLDAAALAFLGRRHTPDDARRAVEGALATGFPTVSIDLIYGLPEQRLADWRGELERALALGAHHFSCYQLTVHERTRFGLLERRGRLAQLPADEQGRFFRLTHELLEAAGMPGYEVSQFCLAPEHRSRHNSKYWNHTPYLGLGPSAHSYRGRERWWNLRRTGTWEERIAEGRPPVEERETLPPEALALEALMTGLRTRAGVDLAAIRRAWGFAILDANRELIERLADARLLRLDGERLVPTLEGLAVADALAPRFTI